MLTVWSTGKNRAKPENCFFRKMLKLLRYFWQKYYYCMTHLASSSKSPARAYFAATCSFLGVVALTLGILLAYASRIAFNSGAFADRVAASLEDPGVAGYIADRVTDQVIAKERDVTAYKPLIAATTRSLISSEPFRGIVRRAARTSHQAMMSGRARRMLLNLADVGVVLRSALSTHPELAKKIPSKVSAMVGSSDDAPGGKFALSLMQIAQRSRLSALGLLAFGIGFCVLGVALSPTRRTTLFRIGLSLAIIALVLRLTVRFGGEILALWAKDPAGGKAFAGIWHTFLGGFMIWALVLGGVGLVLVAAVQSLFEKVKLAEIGSSGWKWLTTSPPGKWAQAGRGTALLVAGLLASIAPDAVLTVFAFLAGLVIGFIGLQELFLLLMRAIPQAELKKKNAGGVIPAKVSLPLNRVLPVGIAAVALIVTGVFFLNNRAETAAIYKTITAVNGYPELCDRRLNEVVFPATHNSMSAADVPNWLFPNHEKGIPVQLNDGVRAFLIDAHHGVPVEDKIKTMLENEENARRKYEAALGKEGIDAAMRIRDRLIGIEEGKQDVYMCHGFCELGASPLASTLEQMREFLVANPNEVLIIVIQDEGVTPQDIEKCFQESRLIDFVYHGAAGPEWPTMREMVASDQRVVVMNESGAPGVSWIHPAFEVVGETPYSFHKPEEFSCKANRGGGAASLFLINHWIDSSPAPLPSNAEVVNAYDFLLNRVQECQKERKHLPNLIAVDFYRTGDLFEVVRTLNGIKTERVTADTEK